MKRYLMAFFAIVMLLCSLLLYIVFFVNGSDGESPSEATSETQNTEQPEPEEDIILIPQTVNDIKYEEIGAPLWGAYESASRPTIPWDMIVFDGGLYVGSGDYDLNCGPVCVMRYSDELGVWEKTGELPDEQISRFLVIDGKLIIPGTDPQEDWELGNYYVLQDGGWTTFRNIPNGIHNYDMVEYNGSIFAGLGVLEGYYPIAISSDGGNTFVQVEMYKNGEKFDTTGKSYIRVYDFAILDGQLYAFFQYNYEKNKYLELYKYKSETNVFEYTTDLSDKIEFKKISYDLLRTKVEFENKLYFSTGVLYSTSDMQSFEKIVLKDRHIVCDIYEENGELYVLSGRPNSDGKITVCVWQLFGEEFVERFNFKYDAPPISFARSDGKFYIGFGNYAAENAKNGYVVSVNID